MPEQIGLTQFFAMEAGDYLERLDAAVSKSPEPDREEFVRLARALRGSALMANQQAFAAAAAGLERLARAVHDRSRPWDAATKQLAVRTVDDLKILVRKAGSWTETEARKAQQLAADLQAGGGGAPTPPPATRAAGPGQRTIIAQQGSGLATALEQAAAALQQNPQVQTPLQVVLRMMHPLRGIAGLADHPPLPDLLEGIERAIAAVIARSGAAPSAPDLFRAAARAVSRVAQEVASSGAADPNAPEAHEFAQRLTGLLGAEAVVSIESLYYDDPGPHIVKQGMTPVQRAKLSNLELVSQGEHLRQAADALERASSSVQRELRANTLTGNFQSLAGAGDGPLGTAVREFARAAGDAVARGVAVGNPMVFAGHLRDAGVILSTATDQSESVVAQRLRAVAAALGGAATTAAAPAAAPAPARTGAPAAAGEGAPGLVGSYQRFDQLVAALGMGSPSIEEFLSGPPHWPAVATADRVVSIGDLLYSGDAANQRLTSLRDQVRMVLAGASPDGAVLKDLIEEVFDLVELGAGRGR
jgi:HPt (histidine-containing phosphotransfer) domain-containing protein